MATPVSPAEKSKAAQLNWNKRQGNEVNRATQSTRNKGQKAGVSSAITSAAEFAGAPLKGTANKLNVLKNRSAAKSQQPSLTKTLAKTAIKIVVKKVLLAIGLWMLGIFLWLLPWIALLLFILLVVTIILPST